ncbi:MAG: DUF1302 domain-containing protein [Deltaproteobacteria bacterium]|nr:MAG: DUF1302 domain-containing protein [Deltaproteobacteria bacterium]
MERRDTASYLARSLVAVFTGVSLLVAAAPASATQKFGPIELSGNVQSQNIVRNPDVDQYHFVQQRHTFRARVDWDWLQRGKLIDRFDLPFIQSSKLFLLYRGVYDSIYDATPGFRENDFRGRKPGPAALRDLDDLPRKSLDALKFESVLREAYIDLKLADAPLSFRLGKQQIIWGEADDFRMLDRANPLDTSWHFIEEIPPPSFGWDDLRIPLWMIKGLWDIGNVGPLSNVFAESYWNPGDWRPVKVGYLPRPWGLRIQDPLTNREDGAFFAPFSGIKRLADGSSLFKQGPYSRTPMDNSQVGVRVSGVFPDGLQLGLHYFYQRWSGDDGTPFTPVQGIKPTPFGINRTQDLIARHTLPVTYITPYIHTVGISGNYFEGNYTQTIFRLETVYDFAIRMLDRDRQTTFAPLLPGTIKRDYWKGMIAFDRPTWIRSLNKKTTFFITGQWFIHHIIHNKDTLTTALDLPTAGARSRPFCGGPPDRPCTDPNGNGTFRDDVRSWESLVTLAIFTFYKGGSVVPLLGIIYDPVNSNSTYPFWNLDYLVTPNVIVNLTQRYFIPGQSDKQKGVFDPWLLGTQRGRSETSLRLTYQF